jgi:hypothetical protein
MTAPSQILLNRLSKLIPMLGTSHDGEVVATARAISAALASEGFDLHDLAESLPTTLAKRETISSAIAPPASFDGLSHFERRAWLDALLAVDWLTALERERVVDASNLVRAGVDYALHWRKKRTIDALIARAAAMGVRA